MAVVEVLYAAVLFTLTQSFSGEFIPPDYDKSLSPFYEDDSPVLVQVSMFVASIGPIIESPSAVISDLYVRLYWPDSRLSS